MDVLIRQEDARCQTCMGEGKIMIEETDPETGITDYWWKFCEACEGTGLAEDEDFD